MKLSPDEDDRLWKESDKPHWFRFSSPLRYLVFLIVLIALLIGLWYLIAPTKWYNKSDLAFIRADQAPYKIKAESQGVPSVKHQDKLVYGRIRSDQAEPVVEHILPDPEAPMPAIKEQDAIKMVEQYAPEDRDPDKLGGPLQQGLKSLTSIEDLIEEGFDKTQESEKKVVKEKILIQLGSLKTYDSAESEWKRLSKKYPDLLGKLDPVIQKVDLGEEKGVYYRLRTGPFEGTARAKEICDALKQQKVECRVIP